VGPSNLEVASAWWSQLLQSVVAFALGGGILVWETVVEEHPSEVLVGVGAALVGWPIAGFAQRSARRSAEEEEAS
jgi:hypothetical protein